MSVASAAETGATDTVTTAAPASSVADANIQAQIDALPPVGGEIKLGCNVYREAQLQLRDDVAIVGSGACTVIPAVRAAGTHTLPKVRIRLENLTIDGSLDGNQYIGVDFRDVRHARIRNVQIRNVSHGVLLVGGSLYNSVEDSIIDATVTCYEVVDFGEFDDSGRPSAEDDPNENLIQGGRCQHTRGSDYLGGTGVWTRNANNLKIIGVAFENLSVGIKLDNGAVGTTIVAPRLENVAAGIMLSGASSRTMVINPYLSSVGEPMLAEDSATYTMHGF